MRDLRGKTAVITGAASGIGLALSKVLASNGMRVVLADIEESALALAELELRQSGSEVLAVRTDVSIAEDVERLAARARENFGDVHLLCNNAGVAADGALWEHTLDDWKWILGVNLWGVIHGLRTFTPMMLAHGVDAHIVNTASIAGLLSEPGLGAYKASKHAVVSISETLRHELAQRRARIGVSVLCPGFVRTRIGESSRNRAHGATTVGDAHRRAIDAGADPAAIAGLTLDAIREDRFWILTHPEFSPAIRERTIDVLEQRDPARRIRA